MRKHITSFIVDADYFTANLEDNWVRIGLVDSNMWDIPPYHKYYKLIRSLTNETQIENMFDILFEENEY